MNEYEARTADLWPEVDYEMRAESDKDQLIIEGYVAKFNAPSVPMAFPNINKGKPFREILEPSAFTRSIAQQPDLTLRYQHNLNQVPLGRTKSGTMVLGLDSIGLKQRTVLADTDWSRMVYEAIKRRDIDGMSFRFTQAQDNAKGGSFPTEMLGDGATAAVRRIHELRLDREISITDMPAYPDTSVYARWAEEVGAEPDALADTFALLKDPEAKITKDQRDLVLAVVNKHTDEPVVHPNVARRLERLAARS